MNEQQRATAGLAVVAAALLVGMSLGYAVIARSGASLPRVMPAGVADREVSRAVIAHPRIDADEMRIGRLHDQLAITAEQESLWNEVAQTLRNSDQTMDLLITDRHQRESTMSAVEDLRSYGEMAEQHARGIKAFVAAFAQIYATMPPPQQANADKVFRSWSDPKRRKST